MVLVFRFAVSALVLVPVFKPRTILQLIIGMLFVFVYLLLVLRADPMLHRENNSFNSFVILQLLFTVSTTEGGWSSRFVSDFSFCPFPFSDLGRAIHSVAKRHTELKFCVRL